MLVSAAIAVARTLTSQEGSNNDQVDDTTQLLPLVQLETEALRSQIADIAPHLFEATTVEFAITTAAPSVAKPADFKRVLRVERKSTGSPSQFYPVSASDGLYSDINWLNWEERGTTLVFSPGAFNAGTYRLVYETTVATLTLSSVIPVPPGGWELAIIERVCAHIRTRLKEDPGGHLQVAADTFNRLKGSLKRRTGEHPKPGIKRDRW